MQPITYCLIELNQIVICNRCVPFPSSKCHLAQKTLDVPATKKVPPIFKRQPCILRVTAYENGTRSVFAKVAVPPSMKLVSVNIIFVDNNIYFNMVLIIKKPLLSSKYIISIVIMYKRSYYIFFLLGNLCI